MYLFGSLGMWLGSQTGKWLCQEVNGPTVDQQMLGQRCETMDSSVRTYVSS